MTRESWLELFKTAVHETEKGVIIHQGSFMTSVFRKPERSYLLAVFMLSCLPGPCGLVF